VKIAILSNDNNESFIKPISQGLGVMLANLGYQYKIFFDGHTRIDNPDNKSLKQRIKNIAKRSLNQLGANYVCIDMIAFRQLKDELTDYDVIILTANIPNTFSKQRFIGLELLRDLTLPILNYDLHFWQTRRFWFETVATDPSYGGNTGFSRFDFYLAASNISEFPLSNEVNFPVEVVGLDLRSDNLYPEQKEFKALIDFEDKVYHNERSLQVKSLEDLDIPYTALTGFYTQEEIRALYRTHSLYFLSQRESFGLPIVEVQLCGGLIFTPWKKWAPSHYIKDPYKPGEGMLGDNFYVYDNDINKLKDLIIKARKSFSAETNICNFKSQYPHLYAGDLKTLKRCMQKISSGEICASSHHSYEGLEKYIITDYD